MPSGMIGYSSLLVDRCPYNTMIICVRKDMCFSCINNPYSGISTYPRYYK